jgi:hypothetical protein
MSHAMTLAYNHHFSANADPCWRIAPDGKRLGTLPAQANRYGSRYSGPKIGLDQIRRDLSRFHRDIDRQIMGSRFSKLPLERRSSYLAVVEHMDSNAHVHLAWNLPTYHGDEHTLLVNGIATIWRAIAPNGTSVVNPIYDQAGWARYMFKDQRTENDTLRIIVSGET